MLKLSLLLRVCLWSTCSTFLLFSPSFRLPILSWRAGVGAWVMLRLLAGDTQVNRFWALVAVIAAVIVYDRLFAVRFQD